MVEYTLLGLIIIASIFFLWEVGNSLRGAKPENLAGRDVMDWIKFFFFAMAFTLGYPLMSLGIQYTNEVGASAGVKSVMILANQIYLVVAFLGIFLVGLYMIVQIPRYLKEGAVKTEKDKDAYEDD